MKLKNGIYGLIWIGGLMGTQVSHAVIFQDQAVITSENSDDENLDAISRFGQSDQKKIAKPVARALDPISENSFEQEHSRSPASVIEDEGSRSPAGEVSSKKRVASQERRAHSYQELAVIANDAGFFPSTVFLTQGIPVRIYITGASAKSQCFMLDQFGVRRQIRSQKIEEVTFVPDQAGTFTFNCPMNGAKGSMIVKELEVTERTPAAVGAQVSMAEGRSPAPITKPVPQKTPDIHDEDFTPEFRSH